jgi:hypothetical protein
VVKEEPHAESLGALHGHQLHLPADMIAVYQLGDLRLIGLGIPLQAGNPFFNHVAKTGTDLKSFIGCDIGDHGRHPRSGISEAENNFFESLNFFLPVPILGKTIPRR